MHLTSTNSPVNHIAMSSDNNVCIASHGCVIKTFEHRRINPVIGIHKTDIFARRIGNTCITRWTKTSILLMNNLDTRIFSCIFFCNFPTMVGATIINKNYFDIFKRLSKNTVNTFPKIQFNIIYRNNNTNLDIFTQNSPSDTALSVNCYTYRFLLSISAVLWF